MWAQAGAVPLLAELLQQEDNIDLLVPVVGVLEECATSQEYRDLIRQYNLTPFLVANLSKDNKVLQVLPLTLVCVCVCACVRAYVCVFVRARVCECERERENVLLLLLLLNILIS